ncbi:MAG: hypothetical protein ACRDRV_13025 [Pseudonocardiaceae bacterium]
MAEDGTTRRAAARDPVDVTNLMLPEQRDADDIRKPVRPDKPVPGPTPQPPDITGITDTGQMFVIELLRREGRGDEPASPARPSRLFRLVAALACMALVLGAVTASMAALSGPRTERVSPTSPAPASIVGAEALRPDLINASVQFPPQPGPATGDQAATGPGATRRPTEIPPGNGPARQPLPTGRTLPAPAGPPPPAAGQQSSAPTEPRAADSEPNTILGTVAAFYQNVAVTPQLAFGLLDPQMRGSGYQDFRNGWADVERVTVDNMRLDGPNAVLVTASLTRSDGTVLRTLQRVLVTPGTEPRITDARLLSASRS